MKVGDEIKAHPNGFYNNGGGLYKVTKIVDLSGKEDIAVVQVEEKSTQPKGRKFKDFTSKFNIASEAKKMNLYQSLVIQILMEINYKCMNQLVKYYQ